MQKLVDYSDSEDEDHRQQKQRHTTFVFGQQTSSSSSSNSSSNTRNQMAFASMNKGQPTPSSDRPFFPLEASSKKEEEEAHKTEDDDDDDDVASPMDVEAEDDTTTTNTDDAMVMEETPNQINRRQHVIKIKQKKSISLRHVPFRRANAKSNHTQKKKKEDTQRVFQSVFTTTQATTPEPMKTTTGGGWSAFNQSFFGSPVDLPATSTTTTTSTPPAPTAVFTIGTKTVDSKTKKKTSAAVHPPKKPATSGASNPLFCPPVPVFAAFQPSSAASSSTTASQASTSSSASVKIETSVFGSQSVVFKSAIQPPTASQPSVKPTTAYSTSPQAPVKEKSLETSAPEEPTTAFSTSAQAPVKEKPSEPSAPAVETRQEISSVTTEQEAGPVNVFLAFTKPSDAETKSTKGRRRRLPTASKCVSFETISSKQPATAQEKATTQEKPAPVPNTQDKPSVLFGQGTPASAFGFGAAVHKTSAFQDNKSNATSDSSQQFQFQAQGPVFRFGSSGQPTSSTQPSMFPSIFGVSTLFFNQNPTANGPSTTTTQAPAATSPPVDHLKSDFDGFHIGSTPTATPTTSNGTKATGCPSSGSSKRTFASTPQKKKTPTPVKQSESFKPLFGTGENQQTPPPPNPYASPFAAADASKRAKCKGTNASNPFATPPFFSKQQDTKQHNNDHVTQKLNFDGMKPDPPAFVFGHHQKKSTPMVTTNVFMTPPPPPTKPTTRSKKTTKPSTTTANAPPQFSFGAPNVPTMQSEAAAKALFGVASETTNANILKRRILRAVLKPNDATAKTQAPQPSEKKPVVDWGEWKQRGGEAYAAKDYARAAECYQKSLDAVECMLQANPPTIWDTNTWQVRHDKAKLHSNRAAALMMMDALSEAQLACKQAIQEDPNYVKSYIRLGRLQLLMGELKESRKNMGFAKHLVAKRSQPSVFGPPTTHTEEDLVAIEKLERAIYRLEKLESEIKWCSGIGDFGGAVTYVNQALEVAPNARRLQIQKADALLKTKNYAEVVNYCHKLVRKHQTDGHRSSEKSSNANVAVLGLDLSLLLAKALHYQNQVEDAIAIISALEVAAPCSANVIQCKRLWEQMRTTKHQANVFFQRGDYRNACHVYTQALVLDPSHDEYCGVIYCNRAAARMGLSEFESALVDCEQALQRKPSYVRALLRRARCYVALRQYQAAILDFDAYLRQAHGDEKTEIEKERQEAMRQWNEEKAAKQRRRQQQQQQHQQRYRTWEDDFYTYSSNYWSHKPEKPQTKTKTHYEVLGLKRTATQEEIKRVYRQLARQYHPDKVKNDHNHCGDLFKDMTAAYTVLSDASARAKYDRELMYGRYNEW